jgi:DNA-binding LytR/AlgR family response regulator
MEPVRVLVVDDERNARLALCELLRDEGYEVAVASDSSEALEKVAAFHPQVVLSDVKMPKIAGVVVVLMSAYPAPRLDGELFIEKPIGLPQLLETIELASALGLPPRGDFVR